VRYTLKDEGLAGAIHPEQNPVVAYAELVKTLKVFWEIPERRSKYVRIFCEPFDPTEDPDDDRTIQPPQVLAELRSCLYSVQYSALSSPSDTTSPAR